MNKEMSGIINKRENNQTKKEVSGHSLAVQWLGLCAFSAVVKVQSLVGELQSCKLHGLTKKKKKKKEMLGCQKYKVKERPRNSASKSHSETDVKGADLDQARMGRREPRNPAWWVVLEQTGEGLPGGALQGGSPWPQPSPPPGPGGATHHQLRCCRLLPAPGLQQRLHLLCG